MDKTHHFSVLTFRLAGQEYGLLVDEVKQIIEMVAITRLPELPAGVQGIINLHGEMVPVVDLRLRFNLPAKAYGLRTPIILVHLNDETLGLVVDRVEEVLGISPADVKPGDDLFPPQLSNGQNLPAPSLMGLANADRQLIPILKVEAILNQSDRAQVLEAAANLEEVEGVSA